MLYICWVERGTVITLHVDVAVETVANLKSVLTKDPRCGIAESDQVLLINGGECLEDASRVAKYQSGTDTNPIFLFSRDPMEPDVEAARGPTDTVPDEAVCRAKLTDLLSLPISLQSITARTGSAQSYLQYAKDLNQQCSDLVQQQHLQHQGWQAVMANLDDVVSAFKKRLERFQTTFQGYLDIRANKLEQLESFGDKLDILAKMPLFPSLLRVPHRTNQELPGSSSVIGGTEVGKDRASSDEITILDWISSKDCDHSLLAVADGCRRTMEMFDVDELAQVVRESGEAIDHCNNQNMKEIRGLADRLFGLDQLLSEAKKYVMEQKESADMVIRSQTQTAGLREPQLSKELANTHPQLFTQMLKCHSKLYDIKRRCISAKHELCQHLHARLKWVAIAENNIMKVDEKIKIYYENIKRIKRLLQLLDQVSCAQEVYAGSVKEVMRRRRYAQDFTKWAASVSHTAVEAFCRESDARKTFLAQYGTHFLLNLFPGLDQFPPQFAASPPGEFDSSLPAITVQELTGLLERLPHLRPDFGSIIADGRLIERPLIPSSLALGFPDAKSRRVSFHSSSEDPSDDVISSITTTTPVPTLPAITEDQKRLLSSIPQFLFTCRSVLAALQTVYQLLRTDLQNIAQLFHHFFQETITLKLTELSQRVGTMSETHNDLLVACHQELLLARNAHQSDMDKAVLAYSQKQETHETKLDEMEKKKNNEIEELKLALQAATQEVGTLRQESQLAEERFTTQMEEQRLLWQSELDEKLRLADLQVESSKKRFEEEMATQTEKLKAAELEVESLRDQIQEAKEANLNSLNLEARWRVSQEEMELKMQNLRNEMEEEKRIALTELEKRVREEMSASMQSYDLNNQLLTGSVFGFAPPGQENFDRLFATRRPGEPFTDENSVMNVSVMPTSPPPVSDPLAFQTGHFGASESSVTLSSCNVGDLVLFVYNSDFKQYTAYLPFKKSHYLLHSDSHAELSLSVPETDDSLAEIRPWTVAEVVSKEYVLTKKVPNRYHLEIGTKFYRVKAKAWELESLMQQHQLQARRTGMRLAPRESLLAPSISTSTLPFIPGV